MEKNGNKNLLKTLKRKMLQANNKIEEKGGEERKKFEFKLKSVFDLRYKVAKVVED